MRGNQASVGILCHSICEVATCQVADLVSNQTDELFSYGGIWSCQTGYMVRLLALLSAVGCQFFRFHQDLLLAGAEIAKTIELLKPEPKCSLTTVNGAVEKKGSGVITSQVFDIA